MTLSRAKVKELYQSGAKAYDLTTILFRAAGLRMKTYRSETIRELSLKSGDFVIELGCGTGLNFPLILEQIGPEGRLVGIDITPEMLEIAKEKVHKNGWKNVELIESDVANYEFPEDINAVLATGLFGYIPEYDQVIKSISSALATGGHVAILDGKQPENLPKWLFSIVLKLGAPFGFTPEYFNVSPWRAVKRYFEEITFRTRYGGMIYILSGVKG